MHQHPRPDRNRTDQIPRSICHSPVPVDKPYFITARYLPDSTGEMSPEIPDHCPLGADGSCCRLQKHSKRHRKAGPGFALVVLNCQLHRRYYTLYPLGFAPYRRTRYAPVGEDGQVLSRTATGLEGWEGTLFEAVACLDTVSSTNLGLEPGTRQRRRQLGVAARLLGLFDSAATERAAVYLELDLLLLTTAKAAYAQARGVTQRALALRPVLAALPRSGPLLLRLLRAGTAASVWGGAWWWTAGSGYMRSFQGSERAYIPAVPRLGK